MILRIIGIASLLCSFGLIFFSVIMTKSQQGLSDKEVFILVSDFILFFGGIGLILWSLSRRARAKAIRFLVPFCGILVIGGIVFKLNRLPSAAIQLILGVFIFSFVLGPLIARVRYEKWKPFVKSPLRLLGIMLADSAGFALIGLGLLFWIQKWPFAMVLVFSGLTVLVLSAILWNNAVDLLFGIQVKTSRQLHEKNKEITDSITYAKRIQEAILPPSRLVKEYLTDSFILYKPKDIVAGDFYWMEPHGEWTIFAAADCTGHGVPGAMVSVVCSNALNRAVREFGLIEPAKILDKTREIVIERFEKSEEEVKDGMDISLCALNTNTNELLWAGAQNPLWLVTKRVPPEMSEAESKKLTANGHSLYEVKADKQPIGKYHDPTPFTGHKIQLEPGDTIYVFSDGYPDQFGGPKGKKLKTKAFKELVLSIQDKSITDQNQIIDQHFEDWRGDLEQIDDVCVIGVKIS